MTFGELFCKLQLLGYFHTWNVRQSRLMMVSRPALCWRALFISFTVCLSLWMIIFAHFNLRLSDKGDKRATCWFVEGENKTQCTGLLTRCRRSAGFSLKWRFSSQYLSRTPKSSSREFQVLAVNVEMSDCVIAVSLSYIVSDDDCVIVRYPHSSVLWATGRVRNA